ncbi:MAG: hypothetical protein WCR21_11425 [Bacteroidota bacterium]
MKKNIINITIIVLLGASTVYFATRVFYPKVSDIEQKLWLEANEVNKTCPANIDEATRLDNATVFPNNCFQYNYTLINLLRNDVNPEMAIKSIEPKIIANIKKDPGFKIFKDAQSTLNYNYRDRNGDFAFKIVITPDKYR